LNSITSSALVEERILDDLKATFNRLPTKLYDRRFALFSRRVDNLIVHFQPIVYLDPDFLHICGWEALARDASTLETPNYLFKVAEQWGPRFCIELDQQIVMIAPPLYRKALSQVPGFRRVEDIKDLSINVYPQSLDSEVYYQMVGESIRQKALPPEYMVLEISEKTPVPNPKGLAEDAAVVAFRDRLKQYVDHYNVRFAIDDFGVGHSSIIRLASLSLNYIKIDRSVIANVNGVNILTNTFNLIKGSRWDTPKVVVEGFDEAEDQKVTLNELYEIGVRYVQGYLVGKIGPGIYRLDKTLEARLAKKLGKAGSMSAEEAA